MTCREVADFLADYLEGELEAPVHSAFAEHLDACPECVDYLNSYRHTIALAKALRAQAGEASPESVPPELVRAILDSQKMHE